VRRVFADTSYYLAILNREDFLHRVAAAAAAQQVIGFATTEWVLTEVMVAFSGAAVPTRTGPSLTASPSWSWNV
jgi:hypothetical protein